MLESCGMVLGFGEKGVGGGGLVSTSAAKATVAAGVFCAASAGVANLQHPWP